MALCHSLYHPLWMRQTIQSGSCFTLKFSVLSSFLCAPCCYHLRCLTCVDFHTCALFLLVHLTCVFTCVSTLCCLLHVLAFIFPVSAINIPFLFPCSCCASLCLHVRVLLRISSLMLCNTNVPGKLFHGEIIKNWLHHLMSIYSKHRIS